MADSSPSSVVYGFLGAKIADISDEDDVLYEAEVLDSKSQKMTKDRGLVVSNASFDLAPGRGGLQFFDAVVIIGIWSRIAGKEATQRQAARDEVFTMTRAVAGWIFDDPSLGTSLCDSRLERLIDGSRNIQSTEYAVVNLPVVLNPTGDPVSYTFGEPKP